MGRTSMTIRIDTNLKKEAETLFKNLGLSMTTAVNIFAAQAVREQRIPFEIGMAPNEETMEVFDEASKNINMSKTFNTVDELMEELNA